MIRLLFLILVFATVSCNPYRGFAGVKTDEISGKKPPSQKIREGHKKSGKKAKKAYTKEMKKKNRRMGTPKK